MVKQVFDLLLRDAVLQAVKNIRRTEKSVDEDTGMKEKGVGTMCSAGLEQNPLNSRSVESGYTPSYFRPSALGVSISKVDD